MWKEKSLIQTRCPDRKIFQMGQENLPDGTIIGICWFSCSISLAVKFMKEKLLMQSQNMHQLLDVTTSIKKVLLPV